jgi:hypothetical protein
MLVHLVVLLGMTAARVNRVQLGLDPGPIAIDMLSPGAPVTADDRLGLSARLTTSIGRSAAVTGVAWTSSLPFAAGGTNGIVVGSGAAVDTAFEVDRQIVSPEYFAVMGMPLRVGRSFTPADRPATGDGGAVRDFRRGADTADSRSSGGLGARRSGWTTDDAEHVD